VAGVYDNTPAGENIQVGMRLMEVGYVGDSSIQIHNYQDFDNFMNNTLPGDNIRVVTDSGTFRFTLRSYPTSGENLTLVMEDDNMDVTFENEDYENNGFLGVWTPYYPVPKSKIAGDIFASLIMFWESPSLGGGGISQYSYDYRAPGFVIDLLVWMFILNLGIGLFNLLPLKPLDGGYIAECLSEKVTSRSTAKRVTTILGGISLILLAVNLLAWLA
jgi:membrane-associated protease RseP (regulator of RpoE activity)